MSQPVSPWVYSVWHSLYFLELIDYFLSHVREVFDSNLFKYFLRPFLFLLFFCDPYYLNVGVFNVVPEVSETPCVFSFYYFYSAPWQLFPSFYLPAHLSVLLPQLFH